MNKFLSLAVALVMSAAASMAWAGQYVPVLEESFSKCKSTTIQGGYFSESVYFQPNEEADNAGWKSLNTYPSERAVKLGTKQKTGYVITPALALSKAEGNNIRVQFRAQLWFTGTTTDTTTLEVSIVGVDGSKVTVDALKSKNVSDRDNEPFVLNIANVPNGAQVKFTATRPNGMSRFFLSDVVVSELRDGSPVPTLTTTAFYHHFNDIMAGHNSEERHFTITGENLTDDITVEADSAISNFQFTKSQDWDARTGGVLTFKFVPVNAGSKDETFTVKSGNIVKTLTLTGNAKVYAPEALAPTNVTGTSFQCNWKPLAGIDKMVATVYTKTEQPLVAPDLMISKYIEGKSNNRALEIFNGTGKEVNLEGYALRMEANGAGGLTSSEFKFPAKKLANGKTYTIANAQFQAVREVADTLIGFTNGGYANIVVFTGNDAIGLFNPANKLIDIVGYESYDTNDLVSGDFGTDVSLYRKSSVYAPSDKYYPEQWDRYERDYCVGYGSHSLDATGLVRNIVKQVEADGKATSVLVDGLDAGTTYYYAVQAFSGAIKTHYSGEEKVELASSVQALGGNEANFTIASGVLHAASATARLYDLTGREIPGMSGSFTLPHRGVYVLTVNGAATKVIY